jgi:hypothetical protein
MHTPHKNGFALFYALLVASLALAIGAAIFDITIREIDLASDATQSQYAVYAADTGGECALYWDNKYNGTGSAFATSSASVPPTSGIVCTGTDVAAIPWSIVSTSNAATTTFTIFTGPSGTTRCAVVIVAKSGNPAQTTVTSHGYNTCSTGVVQLERVFQITY